MTGHMLDDYLRLGFLPEIAGGEIQPGEAGGGEAPMPGGEGYAGDVGEGAPAGDEGAIAPTGEGGYDLDGQRYSDEEVREAFDALNNRASWERGYKQRDMRLGNASRALEFAFGKPVAQFDDNDLDDLRGLSLLNNRLRRDPPFKKAFGEMLRDLGQRFPTSAAGAARPGGAPPQGGPDAGKITVPPELLERINRMETREANRALAASARSLKAITATTITSQAADLKEFHEDLREAILNAMYRYDDEEIIAMDIDGTLEREVTRIAREKIKRWRMRLTAGAKTQGERVAAGKIGAAPAPLKGGGGVPPTQTREVQPERGRGLSGMHKAVREALGGHRGG